MLRDLKNFFGFGALDSVSPVVRIPLIVRVDVKEVMPHLPTVAADRAADGRLLFSLNKLSKWKLECEAAAAAPRLYLPP